MRSWSRSAARVAIFSIIVCACATAASAKCQRMGFTVNDYGKEGPTRDAKNLLDKSIADWSKEKGIKKYTVGKKDVTCELFLNFIVFDEHTCTARATVCWGDNAGAAPAKSAPAAKPAARPAKKAKARRIRLSPATARRAVVPTASTRRQCAGASRSRRRRWRLSVRSSTPPRPASSAPSPAAPPSTNMIMI